MPNSLSWGAPPNTITEERGCMPMQLRDARPNTYQPKRKGGGPSRHPNNPYMDLCVWWATHQCNNYVMSDGPTPVMTW